MNFRKALVSQNREENQETVMKDALVVQATHQEANQMVYFLTLCVLSQPTKTGFYGETVHDQKFVEYYSSTCRLADPHDYALENINIEMWESLEYVYLTG